MPLSLDDLLINLEDFKTFRDISINTDADRLNAYIRESQMKEIRNFLGDALYFALVSDYTPVPNDEGTFATPRFEKLWYGDVYTRASFTVNFNGLKPAHVYHAYERFIYNNKLNVTRYGDRQMFDNDLSEGIVNTKKYEVGADSMGILYTGDARKYINAFATEYPEFDNPEKKGTDKTGLVFFKVGKLIGR